MKETIFATHSFYVSSYVRIVIYTVPVDDEFIYNNYGKRDRHGLQTQISSF